MTTLRSTDRADYRADRDDYRATMHSLLAFIRRQRISTRQLAQTLQISVPRAFLLRHTYDHWTCTDIYRLVKAYAPASAEILVFGILARPSDSPREAA